MLGVQIRAVVNSGVSRRLVECIMHKNQMVRTAALRTVGNLLTGDDKITATLIKCNVLDTLLAMLPNPRRAIRKEACWALSNITAGTQAQVQAVIDNSNGAIFPAMINILRTDDYEVKKEALWMIANASNSGSEEQIRHIIERGVVPVICEMLTAPDSKIIIVALEALENLLRVGRNDSMTRTGGENKVTEIMEECGGVDKLEALQKHDNEDVYNKALKLIKAYFESDTKEETLLQPEATATSYTFATATSAAPFNFGSTDDDDAKVGEFRNQLMKPSGMSTESDGDTGFGLNLESKAPAFKLGSNGAGMMQASVFGGGGSALSSDFPPAAPVAPMSMGMGMGMGMSMSMGSTPSPFAVASSFPSSSPFGQQPPPTSSAFSVMGQGFPSPPPSFGTFSAYSNPSQNPFGSLASTAFSFA